ncbi:MAG: L17 family ribosomal protein [bacterium]|nr:L17 family ribosomal protein [bacterium]
MRHRVYGKHLGRDKDQRKNLFKGLVYSLLSHGTIQTSEAKAKAIKGLVDKVINSGKKNPKSIPQDLHELMGRVIPKLGTRTSGFTQVVRMGTRLGDQTTMVRMSLIGAEELKPISKEKVSKVKPETDKQKTEKPESDNKKSKKVSPRKKK